MKFNIAIGKYCDDTRWQNSQVTWEDFVTRISKTHRTLESYAEYIELPKKRQDAIKDIGGFVSGHLSGGRRLLRAVTTKQILTLDADEATPDFWDKIMLQFDCAAATYSTHKHCAEKPRYRLLIPLDREVFSDEYTAIIRKVASIIGIEMFDHTGYQVNRLMYWPSTAKDGEFIFKEQKGLPLSADLVLAMYSDWQDVSQWPACFKEKKVLNRDAQQQGDPHTKPGLIGAFNRAYPISTVMEFFLQNVYEPCSIKDRYTYKEGTTAAGVVVYDDKFSYSHHSTDPVSCILCNAFDLVRIHKFGIHDFVSHDNLVKQQLGEVKLKKAKEIFYNIESTSTEIIDGVKWTDGKQEDEMEWLKELDIDRKGNYLLTINNVALILENDPIFKNNIAYDEFEQIPIFKRDLPWRKLDKRLINDNDLANIENYIEKVYKIAPGDVKLRKGMLIILDKHKFHPVRDYLDSLTWDGIKRLDNILIKYLGARDNKYTRTVTRKAFVACAARVFRPGIKFDNILTLMGEEGQGKSQLIDKMGGIWFSDTFNMHMLQSKEAYEQIQGVWLIEIGELSGMAKIEVERVKSFAAARQDRYRSPWGKTTEPRLRQCVFFATTNDMNPLRSQNGNRRFWPVVTHVTIPEVSVFDIIQDEIDQLWAEATMLYKNKEALYLDKEMILEAVKVQETHTEENPWAMIFKDYLDSKIPKNWYDLNRWEKIEFMDKYETEDKNKLVIRDRVTPYELWDIALRKKDSIDMIGMKQIKQAMYKIKNWVKEDEYVRFGNFYPRHKGSYRRVFSLQEILS
jgi:predicted P-loop ATPase